VFAFPFYFCLGGKKLKLPNSEDGKLLAAFIEAKLEEMKKDIIKELKPKSTTKK
jgi:hypothetical protein